MRRMILASVAGLLLVVAGVAVANGFDSKAVKQVSATFAATTASNLRTSSCTGADGSYAKSAATYTGTAVSTEPSLNRPARIEASSFVNTTTGVGTVSGAGPHRHGRRQHTSFGFQGVLTHGSVVGLAAGHSRPGRDDSSCWRTSRPTTARPAASATASSAAAPRPATPS